MSGSNPFALKQTLDILKKDGQLIFKFNTRDQADAYLRTVDELANIVGSSFKKGTELKMLMK